MLSFIFAWYNLPFTIVLSLCVLLAILQLAGLGGDSESEVHSDVDHDLDHDVDLDHDIDHDIDHEVDPDLDHDVDHEVESAPATLTILAFLGVGKAPLLVVLLIFFGALGIVGWMLNSLAQSIFGTYPDIAIVIVLPLAVLIGGFISSRTARLIGRALPPISSTATAAQSLVGRRGTVISPFVDEKYGLIHLRDQSGTLINAFAVTRSDVAPIKRGSDVVLVVYDPKQKRYTVTDVQTS